MNVLLVTHAYAERFPHYAAFLRYQLGSIFRLQAMFPEIRVDVAVCFTKSDSRVQWELMRFERTWQREHKDAKCPLYRFPLPVSGLGRRCIGRNLCAKHCVPDLLKPDVPYDYVWFTDVDHVFKFDCFLRLGTVFEAFPVASMIFPESIMIHKTHAIGDAYANAVLPDIDGDRATVDYWQLQINQDDFEDKRYNRAIGGVQIVRGAFALEHGYLSNDPIWQAPREDDKPFGDFRDDIAYRRFCLQHGTIQPVCLPGVYRLRHSTTSYQETKT